MDDDDDLIPISALQHYLYCPRQCALIHIERLWTESRDTAEGRLLHERVHSPDSEFRKVERVVTGMPLLPPMLRLVGVADVVEFRQETDGELAVPIEYKKGRPKPHSADEVQLCAQALSLESMLGHEVPKGSLFYGKTRARAEVIFDSELRNLTTETAMAVRKMMASSNTPSAEYIPKRCDRCSLIDLCNPRWLDRSHD